MAYLLPGASAIFITNAGAGSADAEKQVRCAVPCGAAEVPQVYRNRVTLRQGIETV